MTIASQITVAVARESPHHTAAQTNRTQTEQNGSLIYETRKGEWKRKPELCGRGIKGKKKKKTSSELYGTGDAEQLKVPYFFVNTIFVSKSFQIGKVKAEHY